MTGKTRIAVVGLGYVGMSISVLLGQTQDVVALDIDVDRVARVNAGRPTVIDPLMEEVMGREAHSLRATTDPVKAYHGAEFIVVATPTDYDPEKNYFDTSSVEQVITQARAHNSDAAIVIKSTVPVGFTLGQRQARGDDNIIFSPEFLREGQALYDNLHPSRIVIGDRRTPAKRFAELLKVASLKPDVPVLLTGSTEAEAIKLFANSYLAMRVAFFNELDSFGLSRGLDVREIINGVCLDPRVGDGYNNPSFGYGGYCLRYRLSNANVFISPNGFHYIDYLDAVENIPPEIDEAALDTEELTYIEQQLQSNEARFDGQIVAVKRFVDIKGKRMLDIGCGGGLFLSKCQNEGAEGNYSPHEIV